MRPIFWSNSNKSYFLSAVSNFRGTDGVKLSGTPGQRGTAQASSSVPGV